MNFTREPIIETVITPREGYNLAIRNTKGNGHEDYFVDAVEVVSFGHSFFFRSQERPNSFLVPVSDYEVIELKEARMVLKNAPLDRSIKIGGGREAAAAKQRESVDTETVLSTSSSDRPADSGSQQRKRDHKRRRSRRGGRDLLPQEASSSAVEEGILPPVDGDAPKPVSFVSKLFPPPPTLIKESLSRYKLADLAEEVPDGDTPFEDTPIPSFEEPIPFDEEEGSSKE